jgi:hypothetical protein
MSRVQSQQGKRLLDSVFVEPERCTMRRCFGIHLFMDNCVREILWLSGCDIKDNALFSLIAILTIGPLVWPGAKRSPSGVFYEYQP